MTLPFLSRSLAALSLAAALCAPALSAQALSNPPIRMAPQGVEFMCGGQQGAAELAFMDRVSPRWGVTLEFGVNSAPRGSFAAPVQVSVHNKYNGEHVLQAEADGPVMLARLGPGTYEVQATLGTLTLTQTLIVRLGQPGRAQFLWPSNFDIASATLPRQALAQGTR